MGSAEECEHLIASARPRLAPSAVVSGSNNGAGDGASGGASPAVGSRSSENAWLPLGMDEVRKSGVDHPTTTFLHRHTHDTVLERGVSPPCEHVH